MISAPGFNGAAIDAIAESADRLQGLLAQPRRFNGAAIDRSRKGGSV